MKTQQPLLCLLAASGLLLAGSVLAQQVPTPPVANPDTMPTGTMDSHRTTAVYPSPEGELTVHSQPAPAPSYGPAPAFAQLAGGGKTISEDQAVAYPPLANDFLNADQNRDGSLTAAEYARWSKQP